MRAVVFLFVLVAVVASLDLTYSAAVQLTDDQAAAAEALLNVDADTEHIDEAPRQARQFFGGGFGHPYGGYGGYGGYGRPYGGYGGYGGYGRPYGGYGGYGGYGRPYGGYGGYPGFYG